MNKQFAVHYFIQFSANTLGICFLIFVLSQVSLLECTSNTLYYTLSQTHDKNMLVFFGMISLLLVGQIFVPCFCATLISTRSEGLSRGLYFSNWTRLTRKDRAITSNLILMQGQLMQPMQFETWGEVFSISLPTFVGVIE